MTRNRIIAAIVAIIIVIAVVVVLIVTLWSADEGQGGAADGSTAPSEGLVIPGELVEFTGELDLRDLEDTAFVSLLVPDADGRPISYMVDPGREEAEILIKAVSKAKKTEGGQPDTLPTMADLSETAADERLTPTVTFVLTSRQTVTFTLDLESGSLFRDGDAFEPDGDIKGPIDTIAAMQG